MRLNILVIISIAVSCVSCEDKATQPPYTQVLVVSGDAYHQGFQQGRQLASKIRSLYATLLETSLMPYLNREQGDVAAFLEEYQKDEYADGKFSYEMMRQSGRHLFEILERDHPEFADELRGVADGSGMSLDKIIVLNTFADTMLAFRSVTFFIKQLQAPRIVKMEFLGPLDTDGVDNNGDGEIDEQDDGVIKHQVDDGTYDTSYLPRPIASMVEVPTTAKIRMYLYDPPGLSGFKDPNGEQKPGEEQGMDPLSIRIQLNDRLYTYGDPSITTSVWGDDGNGLEVVFTPPDGLPKASIVSLIVQAGNKSRIVNPPPVHARFMRDERIVFSTEGYGKPMHEIPNLGAWDGRSMPTSLGFAIRGSASSDGVVRLAHHFALLDSNTSHKHTVVIAHKPDGGKVHVTIGWAGIIWGFSGMNEDGLVFVANPSDTLDNPLAGQVRRQVWLAKLLLDGTPIGISGRDLLEHCSSVDEATETLRNDGSTFGWNVLLGDRTGHIRAVEMDSNILNAQDGGFYQFEPDSSDENNLDEYGQPFASVGPDDLRMTMHFVKNVPDIDTKILIFDVQPQFVWTSFYYRSLRTWNILGEKIRQNYGRMDLARVIELLRVPQLVDQNDSMNAVVYEPQGGVFHYAMGQVPATDGEFVTLDLEDLANE